MNPVQLLNGNVCNTKTNVYEYTTIPTLNQYQEVDVIFRIGDATTNSIRVNRGVGNSYAFSEYLSASYHGRLGIHVDFDNNRIGIKTIEKTGWDYQYLSILFVKGIMKK